MNPSIAEVLHQDDGTKGKATAATESDGEPQYEWLLAKLAGEQPTPETAATNSSGGGLYQRESAMYVEIFKANIAKKGINNLQVENVFQTPVWSNGNILFLNYNSSSSSSALSTHDATHDTTQETTGASEPRVYHSFDLEKYFFELNFQYYRYKDWFRCVADSFWGPQIASVFHIINTNRPFIQIAFKRDWHFAYEKEQYYESVSVFLHVIARLRPLAGLGPLTDTFGFSLVNSSGNVISQFEAVERLGLDKPEGEGSQPMKFIIRHRIEPWRSVVIAIED
ncbi:hypothetical protein F4814DRAFT_439114 [Daldinia grandis]|nr:hypothetical protein F4814DRAFT_439114 [Daldinia grandis]